MEDNKIQKIAEAIENMVSDIKIKAKELRDKYEALMKLKDYGIDMELPDLKTLVSLNGDSSSKSSLLIHPDEYFGMSNTVAAEKYLKKVGHAANLDDIFTALTSGGIKFTGNGKSNLNVQLTRATRKFVKIAHGSNVSFGLLEWYPKKKKAVEKEETSEDKVTDAKQETVPSQLENKTETEPRKSRRTKFYTVTTKIQPRKETIINLIREQGSQSRKEIIEKTGIPKGTIGFHLNDKDTFVSKDGKWNLIEQQKIES